MKPQHTDEYQGLENTDKVMLATGPLAEKKNSTLLSTVLKIAISVNRDGQDAVGSRAQRDTTLERIENLITSDWAASKGRKNVDIEKYKWDLAEAQKTMNDGGEDVNDAIMSLLKSKDRRFTKKSQGPNTSGVLARRGISVVANGASAKDPPKNVPGTESPDFSNMKVSEYPSSGNIADSKVNPFGGIMQSQDNPIMEDIAGEENSVNRKKKSLGEKIPPIDFKKSVTPEQAIRTDREIIEAKYGNSAKDEDDTLRSGMQTKGNGFYDMGSVHDETKSKSEIGQRGPPSQRALEQRDSGQFEIHGLDTMKSIKTSEMFEMRDLAGGKSNEKD